LADESFTHLVVVGSSAGGIGALSGLVSSLPEDFDAPIVVAQHLDPNRESHLQEILARKSTLPVKTVTKHEPLRAGVVYVVPANWHVNITDSEIELSSEPSPGQPIPSINLLMETAAGVYGENLIAIVLSGTGTDGTEGARTVSQAGGAVIIQDPETAEFGEMPRSLAPSTVDIVASLEEIGPVLKNLISGIAVPEKISEDEGQNLEQFLQELHRSRGVDFRSYKRPTIMRRLGRRMAATGCESIEEYSEYLENHPEEYRQLIGAFLIKVTEFFRDPELFDHIKEKVLPELIGEAREQENQLRIWSAGCATGEEAYSLAITVSEVLGREAGLFNVRIFATDSGAESSLSGHQRGQLYLILREAVRNAVRHSSCRRLTVGLDITPGEISGYVEDDGSGFAGNGESGLGLRSVMERAALLEGTAEVYDSPHGGAGVRVLLPLRNGRGE
jgi:two-component system CheB/CheR fusion protein